MPHHYTASLKIAHPLADFFAFMTKPKNFVQHAPSDLYLELLTAPNILALHSRLVWNSRRWGVSQPIIQEVATFDREMLTVVKQKKGRSRAGVVDVTRLESKAAKIKTSADGDAPVLRDHARKPSARVVPASRNRGTPSG